MTAHAQAGTAAELALRNVPDTAATDLVRSARRAGIDVWFANPGTTEMPLVAALDEVDGVRPVLGLFEGVCTGAADGFARIAGRPAATLLHLGPGLANGLANLHNARRAGSPVVNVVGEHAAWHVGFDPPLASDVEGLARPMSVWVHTSRGPADLAADAARAVAAARELRGPATLVVPLDHQLATGAPVPDPAAGPPGAAPDPADAGPGAAPDPCGPGRAEPVDPGRVRGIARRIRTAARVVVLAGDGATGARARLTLARIAATGRIRVIGETFPAAVEHGGGLPGLPRLAYRPEAAAAELADAELVVLAGAREPVSYFGYPDLPARLAPPGSVLTLCSPGQDTGHALDLLADELGAPRNAPAVPAPAPPPPADGPLDPEIVAAVLARELPDRAIVSVEGGTCGYPFARLAGTAARHTMLTNTGGAIGQGLPVALGAAVADPGRPVIALQSDGGAHYTIQSLWTMARARLDVTVLIAANHRYGLLQTEADRICGSADGPATRELTALSPPRVDWVRLAESYGVPARRTRTAADLRDALGHSFHVTGPHLIEMEI
ncbi:acetolactate synthase large subunit [Pseudonocardia kongjuensis]|uniref:Acetolactate synthase large subunit n=1 Tax=Pseudonocardia kongjuensis TaxID=102227 RepID=A0ABP4IWD3_9PSEU